MNHKNNQANTAVLEMKDCVKGHGIDVADYDDLIDALFLAAPKELAAHEETKLDRKSSPISTTSVSRNFNGLTLVAVDRGAVYAVWLIQTDSEKGTKEILAFRQFPWGRE